MTDTTPTIEDALAPVDAPGGSWFSRQRYWLLAGVVLVAVASQTRNQQWTTDMWMHAAAVREFASHPFHPGDPVISAVHDSAWLSPYTWVVGRLATLFGDNALTALSIAAVFNVGLLLVAFRSFVIELTGNRRAPFWALLAALLLWGPRAWRWSGVIHLDSIGYVAPYPSMFALAVFLFVLTIASRLARTGCTPPTGGASSASASACSSSACAIRRRGWCSRWWVRSSCCVGVDRSHGARCCGWLLPSWSGWRSRRCGPSSRCSDCRRRASTRRVTSSSINQCHSGYSPRCWALSSCTGARVPTGAIRWRG